MTGGYVFMIAACVLCKQPFSFNPHKVPSLMVNGTKEPLCEGCHKAANLARKAAGVPPWPEPLEGAYEPMPEEEL